MKNNQWFKIFVINILILINVSFAYSQLQVNTGMSPTQLVEDILLGPGINATNVKFTGDKTISIAQFDYTAVPGSNNLGLDKGVFLSTGRVQNAIGVNTVSNTGSPGSNFSDKDLDSIILQTGKKTTDAVVLEFDFIPLSDSIEFKYVFASEEYPEYNCSSYNDVFAFLLTGTNPQPAGTPYHNYNLAIVPGTPSTAVSVNTINSGQAGTSNTPQICDNIDPNWKAYSTFFVSNLPNSSGADQLTFDGYTVPLVAKASVKCGETYHLKIAIADVGDQNFDSGVFLLANSLFSDIIAAETKEQTNDLSIISDSIIVENCTKGIITFKLAKKSSKNTVINYTVKGTASNGVDYTNLPGHITIPANQDSIQQFITSIADGTNEGDETLIIEYNAGGCAGIVSKTFIIKDTPVPPVTSFSYDAILCAHSSNISITRADGFVKGGIFSASSSDIDVNPNSGKITIANSKPGTYTVTYTLTTSGLNSCEVGGKTDVQVTINPITDPITTFTYPTPICKTPTSSTISPSLIANFTSGGKFKTSNGLVLDSINGNVNVGTSTPGLYKVYYDYAASDCYAKKLDSTMIEILPIPSALPGFSYASPICITDPNPLPVQPPGFITGGIYKADESTLVFKDASTGEIDLTQTPTGTYTLSYSKTNASGCTVSSEKIKVSIIANSVPVITFSYPDPLCKGNGNALPNLSALFTVGGKFTSTDNNIVVDPITGEIDLSASAIGTYSINYAFPSTSCNAAIDTTVQITIGNLIAQNTDFSYPSPICITATNPLPTGTFDGGGKFSCTSQDLILSASSGKISLASSIAGTYEIIYTIPASGCFTESIGKSTIIIEASSTPVTNFSYERPLCLNADHPKPILPLNFTTGGVFSTSSAIQVNATTGELDLTNAIAGNSYVIKYTITSSACGGTGESETEVLISELSLPNTNFSYNETKFCENTVNLKPILDPSITPGGIFKSDIGLHLDSITGEIDFKQSTLGDHTISYNIREKLCVSGGKSTVDITISSLPVTSVTMNTPLCIGDTLKLISNLYPSASYAWVGPDNFTSSIYNPTIDHLTVANNGKYIVTITLNNCKNTASSDVIIKGLEKINITPIGPFCKNDTTKYKLITDKPDGRWFGNGFTLSKADSSLAYYVPSKSIVDTTLLTYKTTAGCGALGTISIINNALPSMNFKANKQKGCAPLLVKLNPNTTIKVDSTIWYVDGNRIQINTDSTFLFNSPQCYQVSAISYANGCISNMQQDSFICVLPLPKADFSMSDTVLSIFDSKVTYTNNSLNATKYKWYFGDGDNSNDKNPSHTFPLEAGMYYTTLIASQEEYCSDKLTLKLRIPEELLVYVPNSFTPNGDQFNETFTPVISDAVIPTSYTLSIYNRWGELIFVSHDKSIGWKGDYDQKICVDGTYTWKIEFTNSLTNQKHKYKGHVNLLK